MPSAWICDIRLHLEASFNRDERGVDRRRLYIRQGGDHNHDGAGKYDDDVRSAMALPHGWGDNNMGKAGLLWRG